MAFHPGPFGFDPNYRYWYNNFAWWYSSVDHAGVQSSAEAKIARIGFSLAGMIAKDRLPKEQVDRISNLRCKLFDFALEGDVAAMFEALGVKTEVIKPTEVALHTVNQKLIPTHLVVINGISQPPPKEVLQAIVQFVTEGGRLFFYNSAAHIVQSLFPGKIGPVPPSTLLSAKVYFPGPEKELFASYHNGDYVDLEYNRYPITVLDKPSVRTLAEVHGRLVEPTVAHFDHGDGTVFVFVSRMLLHKPRKHEFLPADPNQKKEPKEPIAETAPMEEDKVGVKKKKKSQPPPKKKRGPPEPPADFDSYLSEKGASSDTIIAFKCAVNVGYEEAYNSAKRSLPCLEMLAKLFVREAHALDSMFNPQFEFDQHTAATSEPEQSEPVEQ
jgi:hypothetical protein